MTRAAEQLYVAQPALGLQIRQLENELGVPLLVRHSRGVLPTHPGRLLYERATDILRQVEETRTEIMSHAGLDKATLVLGVTPGLANVLGSDLFIAAHAAMPDMHLSIVEEMSYVLVDALERDEIDLAIAYGVADKPGLLRIPLLDEDLLFVAAPQAGLLDTIHDRKSGYIDLPEALTHPLVLAGDRDPARQLVLTAAENLSHSLRIDFEASSISMMKSLISKGKAAGIMPYGSVMQELKQGTLIGLRIANPALQRTLYVTRQARRPGFPGEENIMAFIGQLMARFMEALGPLGLPREGLAHIRGKTGPAA